MRSAPILQYFRGRDQMRAGEAGMVFDDPVLPRVLRKTGIQSSADDSILRELFLSDQFLLRLLDMPHY